MEGSKISQGGGGSFEVLLLGDGNFSFSSALADMLYGNKKNPDIQVDTLLTKADSRPETPTQEKTTSPLKIGRDFLCLGSSPILPSQINMTCTSFDTEVQLMQKYPEFEVLKKRLNRYSNVKLLHEINAWQIVEQFPGRKFDAIVWNHPHLGVEDFRLHRFLMAHFFRSCSQVLTPDGFVSVSLVRGQEARWDLVAQAGREGTYLKLFSAELFAEHLFPGYQVKRNKNGESFKNSKTLKHTGQHMASYFYRFCAKTSKLIGGPPKNNIITTTNSNTNNHNHNNNNNNNDDDNTNSNNATTADDITDSLDTKTIQQVQEQIKQLTMATPTPTSISTSTSTTTTSTSTSTSASMLQLAWPCGACGRSFASKRGLATHTRQVHDLKKYGEHWSANQRKQHACDDCGRLFHDIEARWQHIVSKHSVDPDIGVPQGPLTEAEKMFDGKEIHFVPCEVCGQAVPSQWHMQQHLEMLKPLCGMNALCKVCEKPFIEHRALRQHLNFCRLKPQNLNQSPISQPTL